MGFEYLEEPDEVRVDVILRCEAEFLIDNIDQVVFGIGVDVVVVEHLVFKFLLDDLFVL